MALNFPLSSPGSSPTEGVIPALPAPTISWVPADGLAIAAVTPTVRPDIASKAGINESEKSLNGAISLMTTSSFYF